MGPWGLFCQPLPSVVCIYSALYLLVGIVCSCFFTVTSSSSKAIHYISMDVCFLCCQPFNSEWQRKKRKRLYDGSCAEARRLLEDVSLNSLGLPLATYCQRYESDESIFLCCNCEKKLTDLAKCTQRSHALKGEVGKDL